MLGCQHEMDEIGNQLGCQPTMQEMGVLGTKPLVVQLAGHAGLKDEDGGDRGQSAPGD